MQRPEIAVIDYGMGNLRSVAKALELAGANVVVTSGPGALRRAHGLVFPGVGSFGPAIAYIKRAKIDDAIRDAFERGKMFLGLCLGFQLLFDYSEEEGRRRGIGAVKGEVLKFSFGGKLFQR